MEKDEIKEETTNKVLETKIDGLSKLTDERFLNLKETLIRIESNSSNFASKTELDELKKYYLALEASQHKIQNDMSKWVGISIGVSLIGSPLLTIGIAWIIFVLTTHSSPIK